MCRARNWEPSSTGSTSSRPGASRPAAAAATTVRTPVRPAGRWRRSWRGPSACKPSGEKRPRIDPARVSQFPRLSRTRWTVGLVFAGVFGFLGFGMWGGFPVWDDAYLVLFLRESTLETLVANHSHRPLFGQLLKWSAAAFGLHRGPYVAMALALWAILAWQTARLARRVRPGDAFLPSLAALLVLTPVLVTTQFTTATTVLSVNLPVSLALAALLTCLAADEPVGRTRGLGAALLVAGAVMISEYGIAAGFAGAAFLRRPPTCSRRGWVAAGMVAGYAVFRAISHVEMRAKQLPSVQIRNFLAEPHFAALRFIDGLWHSLAGGWAWAAGAIRIEVHSRSTILGVLAAGVVGAVFAAIDRRRSGFGADRIPLMALAVSVAAGILPVALANRNVTSLDPYQSRYLLPVLPFSALALAGGVRSLHAAPFAAGGRTSIVAGLAVYWVIVAAFQTRNFPVDAAGARRSAPASPEGPGNRGRRRHGSLDARRQRPDPESHVDLERRGRPARLGHAGGLGRSPVRVAGRLPRRGEDRPPAGADAGGSETAPCRTWCGCRPGARGLAPWSLIASGRFADAAYGFSTGGSPRPIEARTR